MQRPGRFPEIKGSNEAMKILAVNCDKELNGHIANRILHIKTGD
jgi:hypothetical protein